jgi:hypothetical protein
VCVDAWGKYARGDYYSAQKPHASFKRFQPHLPHTVYTTRTHIRTRIARIHTHIHTHTHTHTAVSSTSTVTVTGQLYL